MLHRRLHPLAILALLICLLSSAASAVSTNVGKPINNFTVPYTSYLYDFWGESVPAPQAYLPSREIRGEDLGVGSLRNPSDIFVSKDGTVYIADTGNNRVLVLNESWELRHTIDVFTLDGEEHRFSGPTGLYATPEGELYVADTNNGRVVHFSAQGEPLRIIGAPESEVEGILPEGFVYRPLKLGVDNHGRLYVIARDLPEGLITFSEDGQFRGCIGAPRVTPSLKDYIWSRLATKEQRARMRMFIPTEYSNLDMDPDGFIYATSTDEDKDEDEGGVQIKVRRLNPKGEDLLKRLGFSDVMGDVEFPNRWSTATLRMSSMMVDVTVQDFGVYSVLDANRGRVFTYDSNGNLMYMFGFTGTNYGQIGRPVAIDHFKWDIFILDQQKNAVIIYEPTDYALLIWAALDSYHRGDYAQTELIWKKVLSLNANNDLAYTGIGRTLLRRGMYAEAMEAFRLGNNRREYSDAFALYRKEVIYANFDRALLVVGAAIVILAALHFVRRNLQKRPRPAVQAKTAAAEEAVWLVFLKKELANLRYALHVIIHPIDGFTHLKQGTKGSVFSATIILAAVVGTYVFARQYTGFIFNTTDLTKLSLLREAFNIVVPFILWAGVNWALTTLMEGKGTFRDIYIATAYSLVPLILTVIPLTILSNYITAEEGAFYYLLLSMGTLWAGVILFVGGVMTTHEYEFGKAFYTCIFTVAGMAFAMFLGFLFLSLSEQVVVFVRDVFREITFRT